MQPGDVIAYLEMCSREGAMLQRGMNFRLRPDHSVLLMSVRPGAPYEDQITDEGRTLIYEGHDQPKSTDNPDPKTLDQPLLTENGTLTQNGLFYMAAEAFQNNELPPERVRVYEKVRSGIWVYTGLFHLVDAWQQELEGRYVCKFKLALVEEDAEAVDPEDQELDHTRLVPTHVKLAVWKRDKGKCVKCGSTENLHFDHMIPFSWGGSSLTADNIQLLCAKHNIQKSDRLE
ncbi:MAG: HNH endonuclease signature motif containing protein [Acidimicrobiia bacterium]|nr:HNH endonuclease signature motif containing protein [Acidimicrobiia bacterium]